MEEHDPVWHRRDGAWVPVRELKLDELREARLELLHRDLGDPGTLALFDAVNHAIEHYGAADGSGPAAWHKAA
jgi:hypothetical protein